MANRGACGKLKGVKTDQVGAFLIVKVVVAYTTTIGVRNMKENKLRVWNTYGYVRLSKEDGDKVKRLVNKPREEWAVVENNHEPIIDRCNYDTVQRVLSLDTHTSEAGQAVEKFAGMVYCGECGAPMVRKTITSGKNKYVYYLYLFRT